MNDRLTLEQVAERLGVSHTTAFRLARNGELPAERDGMEYFVHPDDLDAYLEKQGQPPERLRTTETALQRGDTCAVCGDEIVSELSIGGTCTKTARPICQACWFVKGVRQIEDGGDSLAMSTAPPADTGNDQLNLSDASHDRAADREQRDHEPLPITPVTGGERVTVDESDAAEVAETESTEPAESAVAEPDEADDLRAVEEAPAAPVDPLAREEVQQRMRELKAEGKPVVTAADACLAEQTLARTWGQRVAELHEFTDPLTGKAIDMARAKVRHRTDQQADLGADRPGNRSTRFEVKLGSMLRTEAAVCFEARTLARPSVIVEEGFDAEPIDVDEVQAALNELLAARGKEFRVALLSSPTGFTDRAVRLIADRADASGFHDPACLIALHDATTGRTHVNESDDRVAELAALLQPQRFREQVDSCVKHLESALVKKNSLTLSDAVDEAHSSVSAMRSAFERLKRTGRYNLDNIDQLGWVISRAAL